jgi:predicted nuclease of restriction endonuclease-like (RecB) superfamily
LGSIVEFEQAGQTKAEYGTALISNLVKDLTLRHGRGFSRSNLIRIRQFYLLYPKGATVSHLLTWSHLVELLKIDDPLERSFYERQSVTERWSVRELVRQKQSALFLRLAASKDKDGILQLAAEGQTVAQPTDLLREPYIFEFLKIPEPSQVSETQLETLLCDNLQQFLLELGKGFTFVGRQYRVTINNTHYRVDLVFYHRILRCFVLIDLKIDEVQHAAGRGENAARWLFENLTDGDYDVFATWQPTEEAASNAKFALSADGDAPNETIIDQSQRPGYLSAHFASGSCWQRLGTLTVEEGTIEVRLTNDADGIVLGDAIRIAPAVASLPSYVTPLVSGPSTVSEGSLYALSLDASGGGGSEWRVDWGDGTVETFGIGSTHITHTYADDSDTGTARTILASVLHGETLIDAAPVEITTRNVSSAMQLLSDESVQAGEPFNTAFSVLSSVEASSIDCDSEALSPDISHRADVSHVSQGGPAKYFVSAGTDADAIDQSCPTGSANSLQLQSVGLLGWVSPDSGRDNLNEIYATVVDSDDRVSSVGRRQRSLKWLR